MLTVVSSQNLLTDTAGIGSGQAVHSIASPPAEYQTVGGLFVNALHYPKERARCVLPLIYRQPLTRQAALCWNPSAAYSEQLPRQSRQEARSNRSHTEARP